MTMMCDSCRVCARDAGVQVLTAQLKEKMEECDIRVAGAEREATGDV